MTEQKKETSRGLAVRVMDTYGHYHIFREGGGVVPEELSGLYTTEQHADQALFSYQLKVGEAKIKAAVREELKSIQKIDHTKYDDDK